MTTIYIGYYLMELNLFNSETSEVPCSDQFPVAYNTTETLVFRVKQAVTGVKFDNTEPIKWYNAETNVILRPGNITAPALSEEDRVLTFQDQNSTTNEVKHRFALQMLVNGELTPLGPGPLLLTSEVGHTKPSPSVDPVDPTIIDQGDQGSGGGISTP